MTLRGSYQVINDFNKVNTYMHSVGKRKILFKKCLIEDGGKRWALKVINGIENDEREREPNGR